MQCCEVLEKMRENGIPTIGNANGLLILTLVIKENTKISVNVNELMDWTVGYLLISLFLVRYEVTHQLTAKKAETTEGYLRKVENVFKK